MSPPEVGALLRRPPIHEPEEEARGEAVATSDAVQDVELALRREEGLAVDPGYCAPRVAVGTVDLSQGSADALDVGEFFHRLR